MTHPVELRADPANRTENAAGLRAALVISMAMDPPPKGPPPTDSLNPERLHAMAEPAVSAGAGMLLAKLLPAGVGAALMVAVDTPKTKKDWFVRLFVAFTCSYAFYGFAFDLLHSLSWFSFLDRANEDHQFAVRALLGASGWFLLGGGLQMLQKFRADPVATVKEVQP